MMSKRNCLGSRGSAPTADSFFSDPMVVAAHNSDQVRCEVCSRDVEVSLRSGCFGESVPTGGFFNCHLDGPGKAPCRHVVCYDCLTAIGEGKVSLH